jgi:hypothetical protein
MATVTGLTADRMLAIEAESVVGGSINDVGHLILTRHDGTTIDAGSVIGTLVAATTSVAGIAQLATNTEATTGTNTTKTITPAALAAVVAPINDAISTLQPSDADLTAIAALTPSNGDIMRRVSGEWDNQSLTDFLPDLIAEGLVANNLYSGSAYAIAAGAQAYIGDSDPGSVTNGSVWFDTSGS